MAMSPSCISISSHFKPIVIKSCPWNIQFAFSQTFCRPLIIKFSESSGISWLFLHKNWDKTPSSNRTCFSENPERRSRMTESWFESVWTETVFTLAERSWGTSENAKESFSSLENANVDIPLGITGNIFVFKFSRKRIPQLLQGIWNVIKYERIFCVSEYAGDPRLTDCHRQ